MQEELGIEIDTADLRPLTFASHAYPTFHLLMPIYGEHWHKTVALYRWIQGKNQGVGASHMTFYGELDPLTARHGENPGGNVAEAHLTQGETRCMGTANDVTVLPGLLHGNDPSI